MTVAEKTPQELALENTEKLKVILQDFKDSFKCQKCGKCCQEGVGVALWPHEFKRLKELEKHIYKHIVMLGHWHALKLPCVFYHQKKHKCRIYDKRPLACRMYPMGVSYDGSVRFSDNCPVIKADDLKGG